MLYISRTVFPLADLQCSPYIVQLVTDTPVIALKTVEDLMRSTEELKRNLWGPVYKEEWMRAGGDSDANPIWIIENEPKVAFVGDVVFSGTHSYMAETYYILIELNTFVYLH